MPFLGSVRAAGLTSGQWKDCWNGFTSWNARFTDHVSINVVIPARQLLCPRRSARAWQVPMVSGVTVVQAIAAAGGYTEFAKPSNVTITAAARRLK
jgi:protein involved in polysaccharide export with SLBB domain